MEVHHHPEVEKKGFKEYFLEGLMIFLAVTMGFFAESIREHITDESHIKQLTVSLVSDLKQDTSRLNIEIRSTTRRHRDIDSLFFLLQGRLQTMDTYRLQQLMPFASNLTLFSPENGTITQLKNSGSLRLLGETKVPHYIARYEEILNITKAIETTDFNQAKYFDDFESQHFTPENLFALSKISSDLNETYTPVNKNMRNITQETLTQFSADLMICKQNSGFLLAYYRRDKDLATKFIKYLQKEYHLEDK